MESDIGDRNTRKSEPPAFPAQHKTLSAPRYRPSFCLVALMALAMVSPALQAQQSAGSGTGLREALEQARLHGPLHQLTAARSETELGRVRESTQWANPSVEWRQEGFGRSVDHDIFATAMLPLDFSGRRLALSQAGSAGRERVRSEQLADWRGAELDVAGAWLEAAVAQGSLAVAETQAAALREVADVDAQRLAEGLVSEAVGLRTSLEADKAQLAVVGARANVRVANERLARLMGLENTAGFRVSDLELPGLPVLPDTARLLEVAFLHRPEIEAGEALVRERSRWVSAERRGILGEFELQGGTKKIGDITTGQLGVALPLPLFNRNDGARQRSVGELTEARVRLADTRRAIRGNVRAAMQHYADLSASAMNVGTLARRAEDVRAIARLGYSEGETTLTELLDAERAAADAMLAQLHWLRDAWMGRLNLELAIGASLDETGPLDLPLFSTLTAGR